MENVFVPSEILGKENEEKFGARKQMGNSTRFSIRKFWVTTTLIPLSMRFVSSPPTIFLR